MALCNALRVPSLGLTLAKIDHECQAVGLVTSMGAVSPTGIPG